MSKKRSLLIQYIHTSSTIKSHWSLVTFFGFGFGAGLACVDAARRVWLAAACCGAGCCAARRPVVPAVRCVMPLRKA
jgi:hypothetical protein